MQVVDKLTKAGYKVWIDIDGTESGRAFRGKIVKAIENSRAVIFFSSVRAYSSHYVTKEIMVARDFDKLIIPIKLDTSAYNPDITFELVDIDFIDFSDPADSEEALTRLFKALGQPISSSDNFTVETPPVQPRDPKPIFPMSRKNTGDIKFLFQYKGCLISLTLCVAAIIILPILFLTNNNPGGKLASTGAPGLRHPDAHIKIEERLRELPYTYSQDGFIIDAAYPELLVPDDNIVAAETWDEDGETAGTSDEQYYETYEPKYAPFPEAGIRYLKEGRYEKAFGEFVKYAEEGSSIAMYDAAICLLTGKGAPKDTLAATNYLRLAADCGNEAASFTLQYLDEK